MPNQIFFKGRKEPLTLSELNRKGGPSFELSRIEGDHCNCNGNGKFVLLDKDDPTVVEGGKPYMQCCKCGCFSHL